MATRNGQNVLEARNYVVSISKAKRDKAVVTAKREQEVIHYLSFAVVIMIT